MSDATCSQRVFAGDAALLDLVLPHSLAVFVEMSDKEGIESEGAWNDRFPVSKHPAARSANGSSVLKRLQADSALYTQGIRERKASGGPAIKGLSVPHIRSAMQEKGAGLDIMVAHIKELHACVLHLQDTDMAAAARFIDSALEQADNTMQGGVPDLSVGLFPLKHALAQAGGQSLSARLESLVCLLMTQDFVEVLQRMFSAQFRIMRTRVEHDMAAHVSLWGTDCHVHIGMNPLLSSDEGNDVETKLVTGLLTFCRAGHLARTRGLVASLIQLLQAAGSTTASDMEASVTAVTLKAQAVAVSLSTRRAYVSGGTYDPRLLVFEFNCNMILRLSQVRLVDKFVRAYKEGKSLCHQLIMGAGKTTGNPTRHSNVSPLCG